MSFKLILVLLVLSGFAGIAIGYFLRWIISMGQKGSVELAIKQMMLEAKEEAKNIVDVAEKKAEDIENRAREEAREKELSFGAKEKRILEKESFLDKRQVDIDREAERIKEQIEQVRTIKERADVLVMDREKELEKVASLSEEEAKDELMKSIRKNHEEDIMVRLQKLEIDGKERLESKAREILTTAIHRLGNAVNTDILTSSIPIPSDDIKGKIIGKEGRNIRAFERATGVDVLVDETPGMITLSSFDAVRRQIAKLALERLVADQRIQPAKIEEFVKKAQEEIGKVMKERAEAAAYECGIHGLDPRLMSILGRLHFRTSYGQNVLQHSIEMAHIAGMLAAELGGDVKVAKAGALLHDIGKAVDHEVQGTHVEIGRRILEKFGVDKAIIQAMQAHHEEYPYETVESILVQVADAISGGRPGARRDTVERYLQRLGDLEGIATSFEGVEKAYAIQAGREIRIFVTPDKISDLNARELARDIALRVENELKYPGEIKINVIRETRMIEFAR
ncbi:ribonuclease Y [Candidatus Kaiserbacteria bacterium CG10_big_fil_rev_8_21_14_0_10_45_20]|uniref:Ribonuclease Y n=1 Tax=Candidatus Kaiserbacteria bacterium CG10_big_fil_rev_8_21_14_0_10_45_20 TaxID=1974607 RepID=A0A2H0UFC9_9BACT|nr:MAG: ribonuclease Y [Candidatus Kaiserbacteria bacterium CG10_big_fil_rev_8_21_14_0_10_45_20]